MRAKFCQECGNKLNEGAKFCPECGTKVQQTPRSEIEEKIDEFFKELENASPEDRDAFFKLLEQDIKKKK